MCIRDRDVPFQLVRAGISAICMHTNLDAAAGGVNEVLAGIFGMQDPEMCIRDSAGPLGLRGGGGLCTGRGASAGGHRVRRPGVRGRDPGRRPADVYKRQAGGGQRTAAGQGLIRTG